MLSLRQIPFKNMAAHPIRTGIMSAISAALVLCVFSGLFLTQHLKQQIRLQQERLGADIIVYPTAAMSRISKQKILMQGTPVEVYRSTDMLSRIDECEGINRITRQIYIRAEAGKTESLWITGIDPETDFVIRPWIAGNRNYELPFGTVIAGNNVPVSDRNTAEVFRQEWPVHARLLPTGSELDEMIFVSMETLAEMIHISGENGGENYSAVNPENTWSSLLIHTERKEQVESITNWINIYVRKVNAVHSEETLIGSAAEMQNQLDIIRGLSVLLCLFLAAAMFIIQNVLMQERKKELFVWQTIGADRSVIRRMILMEASGTELFGLASGIILSGILFFIFRSRYFSGYEIRMQGILLNILLTAAISFTTGSLSALAASERVLHARAGQMLLIS